ncbi:MAG TPA: bifunctional DNA-binding transcriptional regulator/O6-methylguanine-DNA methyltransferase Ada [Gemmatimonadaceae bacterium]
MSSQVSAKQTDRWSAVVRRDRRRDGEFVYAVSTTGVFCRPSCGSRRPLQKNVRFFDDTAGAREAGFRPCKRCKPESADSSATLAAEIKRLIDTSVDGSITLGTLAKRTGATPTRIQRTFKRATGLSPKEYQEARRGARLRGKLRAGHSVTRATIDAGYSSTSRLHDRAPEMLGMSPRSYRNRGKGMQIQFGTTSTPIGEVLVAYTSRGVCSVTLGSDRRALEAELREQFDAADIRPADEGGTARISSVVKAVQGDEAGSIPLDLSGTDFQLLVWRALQRIPRGQTRSYREVAESIGRPSATRAVARACSQNQVAVVIPCHRVVRGDGALGGYRWGMDRKRRLLDQESASSKP